MARETAPFLTKPAAPVEGSAVLQLHGVTVQDGGPAMERKWEGDLCDMCGECDQDGLSTFAYVKMCPSLAVGHNIKRAFGRGFWMHYLISLLLFSVWVFFVTGLFAGSSHMGDVCRPHATLSPNDTLPRTGPDLNQPEHHTDSEQLQFLAGATNDPALAAELKPIKPSEAEEKKVTNEGKDGVEFSISGSGGIVFVPLPEGGDEIVQDTADWGGSMTITKPDNQFTQNRAAAKQILDAMDKQFHLGRKLLHKYGEEEQAARDKVVADFGTYYDQHPLENPECIEARNGTRVYLLASTLITIIGIAYAASMRTAIRKKHGIKGSKCQDCLAWTFCAPCALCQESRTMAKNNVQNGVWYGETVLHAPQPNQPLKALEAPKPVKAPTKPL